MCVLTFERGALLKFNIAIVDQPAVAVNQPCDSSVVEQSPAKGNIAAQKSEVSLFLLCLLTDLCHFRHA